ncbi:hypothetical protein DPMN_160689 [Dreissena polymorpha]|uniref:Uncharacterized protein n=1 Tax=Dreissena polymorpha TaxID=45954 RepID=A0A9D4EL92_DREPO|nr:hypothetical protein DPMN_160689 [Dreissena polymorpha]
MQQFFFQAPCDQFREGATGLNSTNSQTILSYMIRGCTLLNDSSVQVQVDILENSKRRQIEQTDFGAVMYIVAVLVFYSFGIVVMIIKYLRREKRELEEERALEDFFRSMPAYKKEREQNNVNRIAIHAFHALTSFSYDDDNEVVYTSDEEEIPKCAETIHEEDAEQHDLNIASSTSNDDLVVSALNDDLVVSVSNDDLVVSASNDDLVVMYNLCDENESQLKDMIIDISTKDEVLSILNADNETHF